MVFKHTEGNVTFSTSSLETLVMNFKLQQERFERALGITHFYRYQSEASQPLIFEYQQHRALH